MDNSNLIPPSADHAKVQTIILRMINVIKNIDQHGIVVGVHGDVIIPATLYAEIKEVAQHINTDFIAQ